ncbi:hypothetical protein C8Q73DRAFT_661143 [Cubamyces lactineus]|nr:hypothetical protein C8Q73DRAFT_661143 [Cubamyces lactineus]
MQWWYSGSAIKSAREIDRLVDEVILADDFNPEDLREFSTKVELRRMDSGNVKATETFPSSDGWRSGTVKISLPKTKVCHDSEAAAPTFEINNIFYHPFLASIRAAYEESSAAKYHNIPFQLFTKGATPDSPPERLYSEAYNTDSFLRLNEEIQEKAQNDREEGDSLDMEYAAAPVMLYSDSTNLASFGTASLWPIYFWLAALSKYVRATPTAFATHHLAYIPSLPDIICQAYEAEYGTSPTEAVLRFCKKELFQQLWLLLLDEEFMHAYVHGFVVQCGDGIVRRLFPRILMYSADYPEKCLVACIKFLGRCPCPDCLVDKSRIHLMGTKNDLAARTSRRRQDTSWLRSTIARVRRWIFCRGTAPEGKIVNSVLGETSTSPNQSAFSQRLAQYGFDIYRAMVPDLMHEFELGVWKSTLTHLVRILTCVGASAINELNARYASIPAFGRGTIRRFGHNIATLKKLAARDFEDLVQCAIPCFEGLLPIAQDRVVHTMLFRLATWHALAKLRLHSDSTLAIFETITQQLGQAMRAFASHVCPQYDTQELDREYTARQRRKAKLHRKTSTRKRLNDSEHAKKTFNLNTYKFHRLGDYPREVRENGTLDNTSTQTGELEHRRIKRFYIRTNKTSRFQSQIGAHERRERVINTTQMQPGFPKNAPWKKKARRLMTKKASTGLRLPHDQPEEAGQCLPQEHHYISEEQRHHVDVTGFVHEHEGDPAVENFARDLRRHILRCSHQASGDPQIPIDEYEPTYNEFASLRLRHNRAYIHKRMLVNYTTYDMRREQSSINPSSQADILLLAPPGSAHPYLYARVLGIFHVNAYMAGHGDETPTLIQVLWVRWYNLDSDEPWCINTCTLPRLVFAPLDDSPFGFISPDQVIRAVHIIPAFAHGRSDTALPGYSIARSNDGEDDEDWNYLYVGIFSDRDLFMRFLGKGIGHGLPASVTESLTGTSFDHVHAVDATEENSNQAQNEAEQDAKDAEGDEREEEDAEEDEDEDENEDAEDEEAEDDDAEDEDEEESERSVHNASGNTSENGGDDGEGEDDNDGEGDDDEDGRDYYDREYEGFAPF